MCNLNCMGFLSWWNSTIQIQTLILFRRHVTVLSPRCLFLRLCLIARVRHMKCRSSWNLLVWEVIVGPSIPQNLVSIPHALVRVWACKFMDIDINKQHVKVFRHWPPAPIWYPWSWDSFNIPCSLLFINDLLSVLFSQKLRMKIFTNTRIKKPVSCVRPDFEKKKYLRKDYLVGKEQTCPSPWVKALPSPSSGQPAAETTDPILLRFLSVYGHNKACVHFNGPDLQITDRSSNLHAFLVSLCSVFCIQNIVCSLPALSQII